MNIYTFTARAFAGGSMYKNGAKMNNIQRDYSRPLDRSTAPRSTRRR
jgi:hypothetical protein